MNKNLNLNSALKYWPLFSIIMISLLTAFAINWQINGDMKVWMHYFMGIFLVIFSLLKIFHPIQFADGFAMYDLLAQRSRLYGYIYPLIELFLGLSYLAFFIPTFTYLLTIIVLSIGAIGVIKALHKGLNLKCVCMGTVLDVPLSTVTLTEDLVMVLMALMLLVF